MRWLVVLLCACTGSAGGGERIWQLGPVLPAPMSNNAVTGFHDANGDCRVMTATGITTPPTFASINTSTFVLSDDAWTIADDAPGVARIAASASTLRNKVYLVGGYSVNAGGGEVSYDRVDVFDPDTGAWSSAAPLPVPIDDHVAGVWRDRWLVIVSGWSNNTNVATVQIYDADTGQWQLASDFPGLAIFGGTGGIIGDTLVVIDGVAIVNNRFELVEQVWVGQLDPQDPLTITWSQLGEHPGPARYRAAAATFDDGLFIHGGTEVAYNYDGLSYDNDSPAPPLSTSLVFDPVTQAFELYEAPDAPATMDHRGLAVCDDQAIVVGGMLTGPQVSAQTYIYGR